MAVISSCVSPLEMASRDHLDWALGNEDVSIRKFADKFNFTDRNSAEKAYKLLISSTEFSKARRDELLRNFNTFNANSAEVFWVKRSIAVQTRIITLKAAVDSMQAGYQEAQHEYRRHFGRTNSQSSSASGVPKAVNDPKNPFLETGNPTSSPKATPNEAESDDVQVQSDARAGKRARMDSEPTGKVSVSSSKRIKDPIRGQRSHDNGRDTGITREGTSTSSERPAQEPEHPDPTANFNRFGILNQEVAWVVEGKDLVQEFQKFRMHNMQDYSLARDGIADMTVHSKFRKNLGSNIGRVASRVEPITNLDEHWPTLTGVLDRVFEKSHYSDVEEAITEESLKDPIVRYIVSIIHSFSHYFSFHDAVPTNINERQVFADLTWSFIRGAMTLAGLETQYLEVLITGVQEHKNWNRDNLTEAKLVGQFADGLTIWGGNQLYLSEASSIHGAKAEKLNQDEFKLARAMKDSWVSQVGALSKYSIPRRGMAVYGSSTCNDETKFWRMDFIGVFRLVQFDAFLVPLKKDEFGVKAKEAIMRCLLLATRIKTEVSEREKKAKPVEYEVRELMQEVVSSIQPTTSTPQKNHRKRPFLEP
ncbi:MAG: hypothetical protein J3Q66DRAFT_358366 [Benniella sp.]|nr:MAG: hypothetical protein J3Q66DRAFT_358366 [Benniella sp.]